MSDHLLHLVEAFEGKVGWRLECVHATDDEEWAYQGPEDEVADGPCWLLDAFEGSMVEIFDEMSLSLPLPVVWESRDKRWPQCEPHEPHEPMMVIVAAVAGRVTP